MPVTRMQRAVLTRETVTRVLHTCRRTLPGTVLHTRTRSVTHMLHREVCCVCVETTRVCHQTVQGGCCTLTRIHTQRRALDAVTRVCTLVLSGAAGTVPHTCGRASRHHRTRVVWDGVIHVLHTTLLHTWCYTCESITRLLHAQDSITHILHVEDGVTHRGQRYTRVTHERQHHACVAQRTRLHTLRTGGSIAHVRHTCVTRVTYR